MGLLDVEEPSRVGVMLVSGADEDEMCQIGS